METFFTFEIRFAMPERKDVVVDRRQGGAGERKNGLVAVREAFAAAPRKIEDFAREMRGEVKTHRAESHGRFAEDPPQAGQISPRLAKD